MISIFLSLEFEEIAIKSSRSSQMSFVEIIKLFSVNVSEYFQKHSLCLLSFMKWFS